MNELELPIPAQTLHVGDLVVINDSWPTSGLALGAVGTIIDAFCHEVCVTSGIIGRSPEAGGPEFEMEWGYIGLFDTKQKRLDRLSPLRVVS